MRIFIVCVIGFLLAGCSTVKYGDFSYTRIGDQNLTGLEVEKDGDKIKVRLETQKSQADALTEAVKTIGILAK